MLKTNMVHTKQYAFTDTQKKMAWLYMLIFKLPTLRLTSGAVLYQDNIRTHYTNQFKRTKLIKSILNREKIVYQKPVVRRRECKHPLQQLEKTHDHVQCQKKVSTNCEIKNVLMRITFIFMKVSINLKNRFVNQCIFQKNNYSHYIYVELTTFYNEFIQILITLPRSHIHFQARNKYMGSECNMHINFTEGIVLSMCYITHWHIVSFAFAVYVICYDMIVKPIRL